jgi:hypothetical protein
VLRIINKNPSGAFDALMVRICLIISLSDVAGRLSGTRAHFSFGCPGTESISTWVSKPGGA